MPDIDYVERLTKSATNGIKLDKGAQLRQEYMMFTYRYKIYISIIN